MKRIICSITALAILASCLFSFSMTANAEESIKFSEEYKGSPYYTKLTAALEDSKDKTTMEKVLAVALSQEGYQNYSTDVIDIEQAKADGLLWTGAELRMNKSDTGNTEYTRWAQRYILDSSESAQYDDIDWCAIFVCWCLYQGGYYDGEKLKKYYYSYCAEPRVSFDADSWLAAFDLDQKNVWYAPNAHHKLDAYNWSTYYNVDVDPYDFPFKPGGLVFFTWDGVGKYFDHVAIVVDYDRDTHILTYTNGNSGGQVITRQIDLDVEEEFRGCAYTKNSNRIMAYAEYDEIKPLEQKKISTAHPMITWDKSASSGLKIQTDSESVIVSFSIDGEYKGDNIVSNMILHEGKLSIGKSEITALSTGVHDLQLVFDDGVLNIKLYVTDVNSLPVKLYGDVNLDGVIDINDATLAQEASVEFIQLSELQTELADVNGDGRISILDVTCIQAYLAQYSIGTGKTGETY